MTSSAVTADALAREAQMHKVLAIGSALGAALTRAKLHAYLPFALGCLAFYTHRMRRTLEAVTPEPCTAEELEHVNKQCATTLSNVREVTRINDLVASTLDKRLPRLLAVAYRPLIDSLRRNNRRLGDILEELEMEIDSGLETAIHKAIKSLGPDDDSDWKAALESMRH